MDSIGPLLDIVNKFFCSPISKCVKYHRSLDESMKNLKEILEELNYRKDDIDSQISVGKASRKNVKKEVELWLQKVQRINDDKQHLELEVAKGKYLSRARLGKSAAKKIQEIEELNQKASSFNELMVDAVAVRGERFATTIVGETTAIRKREEIWSSLISDDNRKIGVFGMGGSGKTTIMKDLHNRILEKEDQFNSVIWITVSKPIDLIKLQGDIARAFQLDIEGTREPDELAKKLFEELKKTERWVIIIDDMWETFNLEDVGIPEPTVDNGCKLILTTRLQEVCRGMNFKGIKMELLSEDEAWNLFLDNVGREVIQTRDLEVIAKDVAKECARLPLAIITIGRSMNNVVDRSEWRNVLRDLKRSTKGLNDMDKVIERVKLSYTRLKDEKLKRCLLYCALYPEDFMIQRDEVIMYLIAEEIVEGVDSWQEKCDEGNTILNKLEYACLLESCTKIDKRCVKMHDVIRDMALQIMGQESMVKVGKKLGDFPDTKEWKEDLETVSLMDNVIEEICPKATPMCRRLKTLVLARNKGLTKIPDSFFVHMPSLRLVGISESREIELLPDSISELEHLRELWLENCKKLKYVPSLAKLEGTLRVLNLSGTAIEELPQGLEMLVNLQYLDLFECWQLTIQNGILSKLIRLQCLRVSFGLHNPKIAEEISRLRKLETLMVQFYHLRFFIKYVETLRLHRRRLPNSFFLMVGREQTEYGSVDIWNWNYYEASQPRKFIGMAWDNDRTGYKVPNLRRLSPNEDVEEVYIGAKVKLSSLCDVLLLPLSSWEGGGGGSPSSPPPPPPPPPLLQPMSSSTHFFFSCLRKLDIRRNDYITKLFTPQLMPLFQNLEEIWVRSCRNLQKIFSATLIRPMKFLKVDELDKLEEKEEEEKVDINDDDLFIPMITLPKLRVLSLKDLPGLRSITQSRMGMMVCNSIQEITVIDCVNLTRLPLSLPVNGRRPPSPPPSLTQIRISPYEGREWWDSLKWDNPLDKAVLQPFLRLPDGSSLNLS